MSLTPGLVKSPPYNLTEQQLEQAIAWAWINNPQHMYNGLALAFNLRPKENERIQ